MVTQCCVCGKIRNGVRWEAPEPALSPKALVTSSYCPSCADEARTIIKYTRFDPLQPTPGITPATAR